MKVGPLEERYRSLILVVADAFAAVDRWPLYPYVETMLDHEHGLSFEGLIAELPPGLVWSPQGYGPQAEIRVSVAALAAIGVLAEDLRRFVALVRHAAAVERDHVPGPLEHWDLRLSSSDVVTTAMPDGDDGRTLQRLLSLLEAEYLLPFSGSLDHEWWLAIDNRIRAYRGVTDVDDYVARRPTPTLPGSRTVAQTFPPPTIFIVMPFGPDWSSNVYDMIGQACQEVAAGVEGLTWQRADQIAEPGRITDQIVNAIENADLIVADLTGNNPNVMFELGYADRARKEVVLLNQEIDATPFDIKDWRQIRYDVRDLATGRAELVTFIRGALNRQGRL
jgi:hypothetical protein